MMVEFFPVEGKQLMETKWNIGDSNGTMSRKSDAKMKKRREENGN
jgi:hypothetical protein